MSSYGPTTRFPKYQERLDNAVELYVRTVANDEWKTMQDGEPSPQATAALEGMRAEYQLVKPEGAAQTESYSQALDDLHDVGSKRRERLNIAAADLPTMLRVLSWSDSCYCLCWSTARS